ncbi:MAG: glutathione peroxidase [Hyphomicrobium sp. 32-62-53]|nr:MAG: glutathione peroxidase [Hyphomicrobium sp. 12-62-95]OYY00305.1 MAG: glutathione peroxidase [Hyphomicrobium sp. 32-62-53]
MLRSLALKAFSMTLLASTAAAVSAADSPQSGSAYDFSFTSIDGKPMPLSEFKGKAVLVVNTASFCGFTQQYKGLQALYEKYEAKGFVVVGVPSNDFGAQEPGSATQIKEFCEGAFGITFPLTEKVPVTGAAAHPFYQWAVASLGPKSAPGWNFHKYLVGRDGRIVSSFYSGAAPDSKEVVAAVEAELAKSADGSVTQ